MKTVSFQIPSEDTMKYDYTGSTGEVPFQMTPPLLQPRRLWTPRRGTAATVTATAPVKNCPAQMPLHAFTIRGGFVNMADGERHLVIAGSMFKHREG
ncbi:MAG: hypothetical protein JW863_16315 [Chitinispirillaceae bacterium]|nr:hypothetical protein [Chitinispirillaceae bacterium]